MKNYDRKLELLIKFYPKCLVCGKPLRKEIDYRASLEWKGYSITDLMSMLRVEFHHCNHDTEVHEMLRPLFHNSILNLRPLHAFCHPKEKQVNELYISERDANRYERFLEKHPMIAKWVNGESL